MARIVLGLLCLALFLDASGCTWTETCRDYPPGVGVRDDPIHVHRDPRPIAN
ncbi:MAG: hypothetical protein JO161_03785 [Planctomycetaceae bacterium]|nr:hypothetical protein [Planctomycetaceae bacterium]